MNVLGNVTISKVDARNSAIRYRTKVVPGVWPLNEDSKLLKACEGFGVVAWGINKSHVSDGILRVKQIEVRVFINGQKKLVIKSGEGRVKLPEQSGGSPKLEFQKHMEFETST